MKLKTAANGFHFQRKKEKKHTNFDLNWNIFFFLLREQRTNENESIVLFVCVVNECWILGKMEHTKKFNWFMHKNFECVPTKRQQSISLAYHTLSLSFRQKEKQTNNSESNFVWVQWDVRKLTIFESRPIFFCLSFFNMVCRCVVLIFFALFSHSLLSMFIFANAMTVCASVQSAFYIEFEEIALYGFQ